MTTAYEVLVFFAMKVKIGSLNIGDIVSLGDWAFSHAIVKNKTEKIITLFRPYMDRPTFSFTSGAIMLTGHETLNYAVDSNTELELLEKSKIKS